MTLLAAALTGGMTLVAPSAAYAADVQFADANLAACVAENLSLDPATTTFDSSALAAITSLDCFDAGIEDLGGIEALVGLEALDVSFNAITDSARWEALSALLRTTWTPRSKRWTGGFPRAATPRCRSIRGSTAIASIWSGATA